MAGEEARQVRAGGGHVGIWGHREDCVFAPLCLAAQAFDLHVDGLVHSHSAFFFRAQYSLPLIGTLLTLASAQLSYTFPLASGAGLGMGT